jgi:type IV pilus assembly protein PilY1
MMLSTILRKLGAFAMALCVTKLAIALPDTPVYIRDAVPPNILLTLDDSGSMGSGYVPDSLSGSTGTLRFLAASFNPVQYNPDTKYALPPKADGNRFDTTFTAAWHDGFLRKNNVPINLATSYQPTSNYTAGNAGGSVIGVAQPAYYYVFDAAPPCVAANVASDTCYRKVVVSATSGPAGTDERQNFANWYSFYRVRHLLMKSSLLVALGDVDTKIRFAWQSLNTCQGGWGGTTCKDVLGNAYPNGMKLLSDAAHRTNLYNWVSGVPSAGGTPLQNAFVRAGGYFASTDVNSPYWNTPGDAASGQNACRLSYNVTLTDGVWNGGAAAVGNADGAAVVLPDGVAYAPAAPYKDTSSNNLSDIAFYYWSNDLQPGLGNNAPATSITGNPAPPSTWPASEYWNPRNDPATWQHLVQYTIGLGLKKSLSAPNPVWQGSTYGSDGAGNGYQQFATGAAAWPVTGANADPGNVYDLWHAAINSRGEFFSAESPKDVYAAFQSILARIAAKSGSAGSVASASAFVFGDSLAYQSSYKSSNWSGSINAKKINPVDSTIGVEQWNSDTSMNGLTYAARKPYLFTRQLQTTANPSPLVIPFAWSFMNADTKLAFKSEDTVKWLGGDKSLEQTNPTCVSGCIYRGRTKLLGDVLGSSPIISSNQDFGYKSATWIGGGKPYQDYLTAKAARTQLVLVGANDGFVHIFEGKTGVELFGYAPGAIIDKMWRLSEPVYVKKPYVDGPIAVGDAYLSNKWGTYAVGTLGAGGKSVYALNISNPAVLDANAVLWEFTHPKLGYVISKPAISRLPDGTWAAIFSGGYENTGDTAILFTVKLQDGTLISATEITKTTNACGAAPSVASAKNGLGAPRVYNSLGKEFYVYAGDLFGHLWRFEYNAASSKVVTSFSGAPMFKACNSDNVSQAITAPPTIDTLGAAPYVYVGTGRFFDDNDGALSTKNTFYAVIDDNEAQTKTRSALLGQQTISSLGADLRAVSKNKVDLTKARGWFVDLPAAGERVVAAAVLVDERVTFNTIIPATVACNSEGASWIFEIDSLTGAAFDDPVFDLNNDGKFTPLDKVSGQAPSARAIEATIGSTTAIRTVSTPETGRGATTGADKCGGGNVRFANGKIYKDGISLECTPGATPRSGWRQLR